jgi:salicylate hydroxylase
VENLNQRFGWIWKHDLGADVRSVERRFEELVGANGKEGDVVEMGKESARL